WSYYCEDAHKVKHSISVQMIGVMIGSVVFGQIGDTYGRKTAMLIGLVGCIIFMTASGFAPDLWTFTALRFITNIFNGGQIAVENLPKKDRLWINSIVAWAPNFILFSILAYLTQDWRKLAKYTGILTLPACLLCCFMPESAQFLVRKGKTEEAKKVIQRICRIDGRECDTVVLSEILDKEKNAFETSKKRSKKYTYFHLFSTWTLLKYTIVTSSSYFIASIINYGLLFNMEKLSGSIYLNIVFTGLLRYVLNLIVAFLDFKFMWLGRKKIHMAAWLEVIFAVFTITAFHAFNKEHEYSNVIRWLIVSVVSAIAQVYISNGITTGELFPTCIRTLAYSYAQLQSRLGVVVAPQIFLLSEIWNALPYLVMGILAVTDMLFFHFSLPETKDQPLMEDMPLSKNSMVVSEKTKVDEAQELKELKKSEENV
ncbi:hypothetical protein FO519_009869, partial [Halicephalobus sp. NKZ332]